MTTEVSSSATRELESAFHTFNQLSEQLVSSYRTLEHKVTQLDWQLIDARHEQSIRYQAKECLINRLQGIMDALPAAVVVIDGTGCVQECNAASINLLGNPLQGKLWRNIIQRAFVPRTDDGPDISLRDGRRVNITTSPLGSEPGQILLIMDVSENRTLQEQLSRYQRLSAMGEMAAGLAHQIRTPLASAILYISHLKQVDIDSHKRIQIAEKIHSRLQHLEGLVADMLMFIRGGIAGDEQVPIAELIQELIQINQQQERNTTLKFTGTLGEQAVTVRGNRQILISGLQNLVTNAVQSTGGRGQVYLATQILSDDLIDILVIDDGPGIPKNIQDRLLEPFFTTREFGTGLGLAVADTIAHAHGGCLWFKSEEGKGSTFAIRLPVYTGPKMEDRNSKLDFSLPTQSSAL